MNSFVGEIIKETDREELEAVAYKMQEVYRIPKNTLYDAIYIVHEEFSNVPLWQLEGMWRAIDAYVDINVK